MRVLSRRCGDLSGSQPGLKMLEVGCGTGHWLDFVQALPGIHLTGFDFSAGMLVQAQMRLPGFLWFKEQPNDCPGREIF